MQAYLTCVSRGVQDETRGFGNYFPVSLSKCIQSILYVMFENLVFGIFTLLDSDPPTDWCC